MLILREYALRSRTIVFAVLALLLCLRDCGVGGSKGKANYLKFNTRPEGKCHSVLLEIGL